MFQLQGATIRPKTERTESAELKTWQQISVTRSHHQAKDRTSFCLWPDVAETCCQVFNSADLIRVVSLTVINCYIITTHNGMAAIKKKWMLETRICMQYINCVLLPQLCTMCTVTLFL